MTVSREYADILYEVKDSVTRVTINRPDKLNAFTPHTIKELTDAVWRAGADGQVGVIVLTGAGERARRSGCSAAATARSRRSTGDW